MPILEAKNIVKHYGGVKALQGAEFSLEKGEVHFLMGSNGCGKSTLCKVISGVVAPDKGELTLSGKPIQLKDPIDSKKHGISVVYQELSLIPQMTVAQNIMLGKEPRTSLGLVDNKKLKEKAQEMLNLFGEAIHPGSFTLDTPTYQLPPDEKQIIEILKVMAENPDILIFDEATASLHKKQVEVLFSLIRGLKEQGKAIVFISHRMEEIFEIGDRATIIRNGRSVATVELSKSSRGEIVNLMVGQKVGDAYSKHRAEVNTLPVLSIDSLTSSHLKKVTFALKEGEILGLGGLHGQGQSELLLSLFGALPVESGKVVRKEKEVTIRSPSQAIQHSFAYISGDRKKYGVLLIRPILENMILSFLFKKKVRLFSRKTLSEKVSPIVEKLKLVFGGLASLVNELSGGNQQKVVIGRWLMTDPQVLLMDDPTKGIDIQAKEELYALMETMCKDGLSIIWNSSEDQELLSNANRVLVFNEGAIVDELKGDRLTEFELYQAALGSGQETQEGEK